MSNETTHLSGRDELLQWILIGILDDIKVDVRKIKKEQKHMANRVEEFKNEVTVEFDKTSASLDKIKAEEAVLIAAVADLAAKLEAAQNLSDEEKESLVAVVAAAAALGAKAKDVDDQVADPTPTPEG